MKALEIKYFKLGCLIGLLIIGLVFCFFELGLGIFLVAIGLLGIPIMLLDIRKYELWFCARCGNFITTTKRKSGQRPLGECEKCHCKTFIRKKYDKIAK